MKLKTIRLLNFCCFADSGAIPFHNMTIFIGENDCGKSAILKALTIFFGNEKMTLENFRKVGDKYEKRCEIELTFVSEDDDVLQEYRQYLIENEVKIKRVYQLEENNVITTEILTTQYEFVQTELNHTSDLKAAELKEQRI